MQTSYGHLSYCTNIHAGESWPDHFASLKHHLPGIKKSICPDKPFGIGLRLSNVASLALTEPGTLAEFKQWLVSNDCYVFTMNGFPYGGFHNTVVKDQVHAPDWQSEDRVNYTIRLFDILDTLIPEHGEGSISTSPLSYKYWHSPEEFDRIFVSTTANMVRVLGHLVRKFRTTGKILHLDIEPEPDGLLESGPEFIHWFEHNLMPAAQRMLQETFGFDIEQSVQAVQRHVRLCYDVCHFAVGYEDHREVLATLKQKNISVGKIQISAALKSVIPAGRDEREKVFGAFRQFDETTYLHQVVARQGATLKRYPDLPEALMDQNNPATTEWRSHFHVPLFVDRYDVLQSTQEDIREVLNIHRQNSFTNHLEVETYTWEVLPSELRVPIADSIIREVRWVQSFLETGK